jgi:GTPase SAR1 family protein
MQGLSNDYVYKLKILIFGSKGRSMLIADSGKSSLVYSYLHNSPPLSPFIN